ncbi:hypothetical protein [Algoriphagus sp. CAU 1675]|uniref:hypothetical protein n=1 Tax=Algoriphagus sp. CAU 1675 TaxID=3032597 RepID=UPI0023DB6B61|nr:hypothetical protein [Algoriphagus sp. CAU 1675]MDF2159106.1 hypothetical protein [Algoriphagus sp. CAU 1675]
MFLVVGGMFLPFLEEINFRLSLLFKPIYLSLTSAGLTYYLVTKLVYSTKLSMVDESFFQRLISALLVGFVAFIIVSYKPIKNYLIRFWAENFRFIYYASCVLFAWLHIFNFKLTLLNVLLLPILTLPQLFSATIAGYTRVAFGFQYPLLVHMATNTLFISLSLFL